SVAAQRPEQGPAGSTTGAGPRPCRDPHHHPAVPASTYPGVSGRMGRRTRPARCLFAGAVVSTRPTPLRVAPRHLPLDSPPRGRVYTLSVALLGNPGMKAP